MDFERMKRVDPEASKGSVGGMKFSKTEVFHIAVAVLVLTLAFTIILSKGGSVLDSNKYVSLLKIFGIALILVTFSFLIHEFGHKYVAQFYGAWSEFRMYPAGLFMALIFSVFGFLFAAPGAVYIRGNITNEQNGKISLAGPMMNFMFAAASIGLSLVTTGLTQSVFFQLAWLNAFLGLFNLIPFPPFDGYKIASWNLPVYILCALIGIAEIAIIWL